MKNKSTHGGRRKGAGRPPLPEKMRRRPIGMLESDWQKVTQLAESQGISVDEIIRRLIRAE